MARTQPTTLKPRMRIVELAQTKNDPAIAPALGLPVVTVRRVSGAHTISLGGHVY